MLACFTVEQTSTRNRRCGSTVLQSLSLGIFNNEIRDIRDIRIIVSLARVYDLIAMLRLNLMNLSILLESVTFRRPSRIFSPECSDISHFARKSARAFCLGHYLRRIRATLMLKRVKCRASSHSSHDRTCTRLTGVPVATWCARRTYTSSLPW